ncbi:hypothetical protein TNCT_738731 [Trichonephila clavata]|uniref:Uncharacterized protein n=1 Tax=Trichonephila clavata TaxID=2740835 RepID=A0A8X6H543_TRICU|nr:hypothetical protein TNCT_738731 [Trichonephila clavata]
MTSRPDKLDDKKSSKATENRSTVRDEFLRFSCDLGGFSLRQIDRQVLGNKFSVDGCRNGMFPASFLSGMMGFCRYDFDSFVEFNTKPNIFIPIY